MKLSNFLSKKVLNILPALLLTFPLFLINKTSVKAEGGNNYSVQMSVDKSIVKAGEQFQITIIATNSGDSNIDNFELRLPFYNKIVDTTGVAESPSFNKRLEGSDFPEGFNNRSWIINSFEPGASKTFNIQYRVIENPSNSNDIIAKFTLPTSWNDPEGLKSGEELSINYMRTDVYIGSSYKSSSKVLLPRSEVAENEFAGVKLNQIYYFTNSKSTNIRDINKNNMSSFPNFTLETKDVLVKWSEPIDFSSSDVIEKLKKFDSYFKVEWGKVFIDIKQLPFLSKPAQITFKNVDLINEPKIRIDNSLQSLSESNAKLLQKEKLLTVDSKKLYTTAIAPNLIFEDGKITTSDKSITIKGKAVDTTSKITYKYDDQKDKEFEVSSIDLKTGEFEIHVDDTQKTKKVTVVSTFSTNKESMEKELTIEYKEPETAAKAEDEVQKKSTYINNPITIALGLVALAILSILGGYIYFLYHRKKKSSAIVTDKNKITSKPTFSRFDNVNSSEKPPVLGRRDISNNDNKSDYLKDE